jgi:hypothetical protein
MSKDTERKSGIDPPLLMTVQLYLSDLFLQKKRFGGLVSPVPAAFSTSGPATLARMSDSTSASLFCSSCAPATRYRRKREAQHSKLLR